LRRHYKHDEEGDPLHQIEAATEGMSNHIIVAGYGRVGQLVHRFTANEKYEVIALDRDAQRVQEATNAGLTVCFGDAARSEVLKAAGIERARMVVVCVDRIDRSTLITQRARALNAEVPILVRTQDDTHADQLRENGATEIVPEILEGSLMLVSHVMVMLGVPVSTVLQRVQRARRDRYRQLKGFFFGAGADVTHVQNKAKQQLHAITLTDNCVSVGKTIESLRLEGLQIEVRNITRGHHEIQSPESAQVLQAGDTLVLMGPPEAMEAAEHRLLSGRPKFSRL
jgi:CPA2 family monovalent cation:H+ antiporter-2